MDVVSIERGIVEIHPIYYGHAIYHARLRKSYAKWS